MFGCARTRLFNIATLMLFSIIYSHNYLHSLFTSLALFYLKNLIPLLLFSKIHILRKIFPKHFTKWQLRLKFEQIVKEISRLGYRLKTKIRASQPNSLITLRFELEVKTKQKVFPQKIEPAVFSRNCEKCSSTYNNICVTSSSQKLHTPLPLTTALFLNLTLKLQILRASDLVFTKSF